MKNPLVAQVKFSAVCLNRHISKNEYLQVQYILENASNAERITPPSFKNFYIVSGPNQQSGMSNINGNIKQYIAVEFILKPISAGSFTLSPATAKVGGKTLLSNSLSVSVSNKSSRASAGPTSLSPFGNIMTDVLPAAPRHQFEDYILRKGENVDDKVKKNLFVNLVVNKTSCYVGEPIVATYKLYTRLKSESNLIKSPSFNGFSVSEMDVPDNLNLSTEKLNGREYSVYVLRKVQLYPLQAGTFELEPIVVENNITFLNSDYANAGNGDILYDMMRDFAGTNSSADAIEQKKVTLQSKPLNIIVKPLPDTNQPKFFKGAVGNFNFNAEVHKNAMTTDEADNLALSISGNGNIQMINAPAVNWPEGIEAFESKSSESIDKATAPLKGKKTFNFPFTISRPGKYSIPSVNFSYFDVTTQSYKTISTKPLNIEVKKASKLRQLISGNLKNVNGKPETFQEIILDMWWAFLISLLILAGLVFWLATRKKRTSLSGIALSNAEIENSVDDIKSLDGLDEVQITQNPLLPAGNMLSENPANFYQTINNCLRNYLSGKLKFPENELNKKKINELLDKHNVSIGTTLLLTSLLENIELNLYAPPSSSQQMQDVYDKAGEVVALLDKQIN